MKAYFGIGAMLTLTKNGGTGRDPDNSRPADDFSALMLEYAEKHAFPPT